MKRQWLREQWETYRLIIPKQAGEIQLIETKRAFYAGAGAMFDLMTNTTPGPHVQQEDLDKLTTIAKELVNFIEREKEEHGINIKFGNA